MVRKYNRRKQYISTARATSRHRQTPRPKNNGNKETKYTKAIKKQNISKAIKKQIQPKATKSHQKQYTYRESIDIERDKETKKKMKRKKHFVSKRKENETDEQPTKHMPIHLCTNLHRLGMRRISTEGTL